MFLSLRRSSTAPWLVAVGYVLIRVVGSYAVVDMYGGGLLWLPEGLALGFALVYGSWVVVGVLPAGLAVGLWLGYSPLQAVLLAVASASAVWFALRFADESWRARPVLRSLGDALTMWRVAMLLAAVSAVLTSLVVIPLDIGLVEWLTGVGEFFLADLLGIVLLAPVTLALLQPEDRSRRTGSNAEFLAGLLFLFTAAALIIFLDLPGGLQMGLNYLLGPLLLILVLRFGWREAAFTLILMAPLVFASTSLGIGPLGGSDLVQARILLQFVFIGVALMSHIIVALMDERRGIIMELEGVRDELEERVRMRTDALSAANRELSAEMAERKKVEAQLREHHAMLEVLVHERTIELEEANHNLTEALRAKAQFLANMSHELRTPLNSIIGFSEVLSRGMAGELSEEQARQIRMVNSSGRHLLALVNDILDITKIEAGAVRIQVEQLVLEPVVAMVIDSMAPLSAEKGLRLDADIEPDLQVCTDRVKLQQILINLVGNSIKFTLSGSIRVSARQLGKAVMISVTDTGVGIEANELAEVFSEFHQSRSVQTGKPIGTGLGLSISRRLARLLDGDLTGESEYGVGSTFTLLLPGVPTRELSAEWSSAPRG